MTFMKVTFVLIYCNGAKREFEKHLLDTGDYSEAQWIAEQYLEENKSAGCTNVTVFRDGEQVADTTTPT